MDLNNFLENTEQVASVSLNVFDRGQDTFIIRRGDRVIYVYVNLWDEVKSIYAVNEVFQYREKLNKLTEALCWLTRNRLDLKYSDTEMSHVFKWIPNFGFRCTTYVTDFKRQIFRTFDSDDPLGILIPPGDDVVKVYHDWLMDTNEEISRLIR